MSGWMIDSASRWKRAEVAVAWAYSAKLEPTPANGVSSMRTRIRTTPRRSGNAQCLWSIGSSSCKWPKPTRQRSESTTATGWAPPNSRGYLEATRTRQMFRHGRGTARPRDGEGPRPGGPLQRRHEDGPAAERCSEAVPGSRDGQEARLFCDARWAGGSP